MGVKMKSEKNSLVLLSSKKTKVDTKTRADEAFALPSFPETTAILETELPSHTCKEVGMDLFPERDVETLKQTMLKHEAMFREQVRELHRLYQVQQVLMADLRRKESTFLAYPVPSSSKSSHLPPVQSEFGKPSVERSFLEAITGSLNTSLQDCIEIETKPEQVSKLNSHLYRKVSQQKVVEYTEHVVDTKSEKLVRKAIDLERPPEEYMGDEEQGEKLEEEIVFRLTPGSQNSEPGSNVCLSLGSGWDREDFGKKETIAMNLETNSWENGRHCISLLNGPRCVEVPFFPLDIKRAEISPEEAPTCSTPIFSTKSLLEGLSHKIQGCPSEDIPILEWQKSDAEHGRQSLDLEAGERFTQESPKQPHWLLQVSATVVKTSVNPLTQSSGWHRPLPFFLQKQGKDDTNKPTFAPEEIGRHVSFQEQITVSNSTSATVGLNHGSVFASGPQAKSPVEIGVMGKGSFAYSHQVDGVKTESIPPTCSWKDEDDAGQLRGRTFMQSYPLVATIPSNIQAQVLESESSVPSQTHFVSGLSGGSSQGSMQDSTIQQFDQHRLWPLVQCEQGPIHQSEGLPSTGHAPWQIHVPVGAVSRQRQPAGIDEICATEPLGPTVDLLMGQNVGVTEGNNAACGPPSPGYVAVVPNTQANTGRPAELKSAIKTADVELTLAPFMNNLHETINYMNSYSSEAAAIDRDSSDMLQMTPVKEVKWLGASFAGEELSASGSICLSECSCSAGIKNNIDKTVPFEEVRMLKAGDEVEALDKESLFPEQDLQVLQVGPAQKEIRTEETIERENLYTRLVKMELDSDDHDKSDVCIPGQPKSQGSHCIMINSESNENMPQAKMSITAMPGESNLLVAMQQEMLFDIKKDSETVSVEMLPLPLSEALDVADTNHQITKRTLYGAGQANESSVFSDDIYLTNQAADILLTLASSLSFAQEMKNVKDHISNTPEWSLEWFANIIPREESGGSALVHSAGGLIHLPETTGGQGSPCHETLTCTEESDSHTQPDVNDEEQRSEEVRPPETLDFFESVTLMLKTSGISTNVQCSHVFEHCKEVGERSPISGQRGRFSRRGRVGRDFQRELLPSITSLSRQEITEDLQTIGELLRSSTEVATRRSASSLSFKEDGSTSPAVLRSIRSIGGARGNRSSEPSKIFTEREGKGRSNGFPPLSSWGDSTGRRGMRRHRSQWSLLPAGI